jgi:GNAT superfamily N-acetyltransferase
LNFPALSVSLVCRQEVPLVTFRKADTNDTEELIALRIAFLKENSKKVCAEEEYRSLERSLRAFFTDALRNATFISWIAADGDEIIGTSGLTFYALPPGLNNPSGRVAYIMNMYTKPSHRRRGICAELFHRTVEEARSLGYGKIELHATPKGMNIYKRQGFKEQVSVGLLKYIGGAKENDDHA